jgi:hypothetical protein
MGASVTDEDFTAMILGSLPDSYRPLLSSLTAIVMATRTPLLPNDLKQYIIIEYEHNKIRGQASGKTALVVKGKDKQLKKGWKKKAKSDVECGNCHKKGHTSEECWAPGGGAEGKGRHQKKNQPNANSATAAMVTAAATSPPNEEYAFACTSSLQEVGAALDSKGIDASRRGAIVDSGASSHFCSDLNKFVSYQAFKSTNTGHRR